MRSFLAAITRDPVSLAGTALTTAAALLFVFLFAIEQVGFQGGPYLGIIAFLVLPALFVLGLLLIPLGQWRERRRKRRAAERGEAAPELPVWDLNDERTRRHVLIFSVATALNLLLLAVATYKGVQVMDSTAFCGTACHTVMQPEHTTYQRSAHARVACVECHIGPGAGWFVQSKLSGSWQLVSVTFDLYPRPIPVPVHDLRPARETCEHCHWPAKFVGDRLRVVTRFSEDEGNSELKTVLNLKVGGMREGGSHGIHWHVDPGNLVRYRADQQRAIVYEVEVAERGRLSRRFEGPKAAEKGDAPWRTMDCLDCHNRPSHIYRLPDDETDAALADGRLDRTLPFLRREAVLALKQDYPSHEAARAGISEAISAFYRGSHPGVARDRAAAVAAAGKTLGEIWATNVFPAMNVRWGTYPSHLGHTSSPGCFRCHDEEHAAADGKTISGDCPVCHVVLADGEPDPAVLRTLAGE